MSGNHTASLIADLQVWENVKIWVGNYSADFFKCKLQDNDNKIASGQFLSFF